MVSKRQFYKYEITICVLTEDPIPLSLSVEDIADEAMTGGYSMVSQKTSRTKIDGPEVAKLLEGQGTEPEFFSLDAEGNDLDAEDDG